MSDERIKSSTINNILRTEELRRHHGRHSPSNAQNAITTGESQRRVIADLNDTPEAFRPAFRGQLQQHDPAEFGLTENKTQRKLFESLCEAEQEYLENETPPPFFDMIESVSRGPAPLDDVSAPTFDTGFDCSTTTWSFPWTFTNERLEDVTPPDFSPPSSPSNQDRGRSYLEEWLDNVTAETHFSSEMIGADYLVASTKKAGPTGGWTMNLPNERLDDVSAQNFSMDALTGTIISKHVP